MVKIPNSGIAPYSGIGLVRAVWGSNEYTGTGCLLDSTHVLTCAHIVATKGGGPHATGLYFHPRWNSAGWPSGSGIQVATWSWPSQFAGGDQSWDIAVGVLSTPVPPPASGAFYFTRQVVEGPEDVPPEVEISGYPGDGHGYLWSDTGAVAGVDVHNNAMSYTVMSAPGSSGSPVFAHYPLHGLAKLFAVHIKQYEGDPIGILLTPAVNSWVGSKLG